MLQINLFKQIRIRMSKFRSKLSRYNTICCEQVMPVPVIPVCAVSCCIPRPICELRQAEGPCEPTPSNYNSAPTQHTIPQFNTASYNPGIPPAATGTILTNSTGSTPLGYLLCDGAEVSRTEYAALFSVIGGYYGNGNGTTTFSIPNFSPSDPSSGVTYIIKT